MSGKGRRPGRWLDSAKNLASQRRIWHESIKYYQKSVNSVIKYGQFHINPVFWMEVNVNLLFKEVKYLQQEVEKNNALLLSLIPEEKVSAKELARLRRIKSDMDAGKAIAYSEDLF